MTDKKILQQMAEDYEKSRDGKMCLLCHKKMAKKLDLFCSPCREEVNQSLDSQGTEKECEPDGSKVEKAMPDSVRPSEMPRRIFLVNRSLLEKAFMEKIIDTLYRDNNTENTCSKNNKQIERIAQRVFNECFSQKNSLTLEDLEHIRKLALADGLECNSMLISASPTSQITDKELQESIEKDKIILKKLGEVSG